MEFLESIPVAFKEIMPNQNIPEKWKEVVLNTGGTHSTLQDIKLPHKGGGYWYKESKKANTRNRFIYWQTTSDSIELSEASLDVNISGCHLRCKLAAGTPPLNNISVYERLLSQEVIILAATVSSVHRLIFPHPESFDKKATFGSMSTTTLSIFRDTAALNNPNNYYILNQYSNQTSGVAHTCASYLRDSGEAVFALAFGHGLDGGLLVVKLPVTGSATTSLLKREYTIPRFLSGITGALRGKNSDSVDTYGVELTQSHVVAVCGDTCLRAWALDNGGAPAVVSQPLSQTQEKCNPSLNGHMLQKTTGSDGSALLVAYLSFPSESEFVVVKMHNVGAGVVKFSHTCRIFGPQLDLLDYCVAYGDGTNVIWALWSQPDGETLITSSAVGGAAGWRAVCGREAPPALPLLPSHHHYRDRLLAPGLFPPQLVAKALLVYRRMWGGGGSSASETSISAEAGELGEAAVSAVAARLRQLAARAPLHDGRDAHHDVPHDHAHLMHKCWSDLYSWCMQYMESLQKPLGLMVNTHSGGSGWWCGTVRRGGVSLVRQLDPLERIMLSPEHYTLNGENPMCEGEGLSVDAVRVVVGGVAWERAVGAVGARDLERRLFAAGAPQHRLLPRLLHLLLAPTTHSQTPQNAASPEPTSPPAPPTLSPQQIEEICAILEPIRDLQSAVLELNDALRLDVPDIDINKDDDEYSEYHNLFASDLGVSIVTEAIRQMAEIRCRVVRGALAALSVSRGAGGVPGGGHCAVHWQAYRALLWLRNATLMPPAASTLESFRLKISALGGCEIAVRYGSGAAEAYAGGEGGRRARAHLAAARAPTAPHHALPLMAYHIAHQLWAVSGGFEFGWWLASVNQPRLVHSYVAMLEPWCEWNACSRQFILGLALLELEDAEGAYTAFCRAAKGVGTEPFLRQLVTASDAPLTQHHAIVLYYMKVIKLFEIHDAGACVVRLAETAISIADKDDPNLPMFQWVVFKWHLSGGRVSRALSAAAANPAPTARAAAAATLLTTLASRNELGLLVSCGALSAEAERAAAARARLHDAHAQNPYYDFLYALHLSRHHYRKAAAVMYERAARCGAERDEEGAGAGGAGAARRRFLAAALTTLRLAPPHHAFLAAPTHRTHHDNDQPLQVIGPEELAAELREEDPNSVNPVQQALLRGENIDFNELHSTLKETDAETILEVTKRVLSTGQFLPQWFLQRYMDVDAGGCIRALLRGGRVAEAGALCCAALRTARAALQPHRPTQPRAAPLALADLLLAELEHNLQHPACKEIYDDLNSLIQEYVEVAKRKSQDMKMLKSNQTVY